MQSNCYPEWERKGCKERVREERKRVIVDRKKEGRTNVTEIREKVCLIFNEFM